MFGVIAINFVILVQFSYRVTCIQMSAITRYRIQMSVVILVSYSHRGIVPGYRGIVPHHHASIQLLTGLLVVHEWLMAVGICQSKYLRVLTVSDVTLTNFNPNPPNPSPNPNKL